MIKNNNLIIKQINSNNLLIFLILLFGVLVPVFSATDNYNFWNQLFNILNNEYFIFALFTSVGINALISLRNTSNNYNIISRTSKYKNYIKFVLKKTILSNLLNIIIALILAIAGAIVFSYGNFSNFNHPFYEFSIILYLLFFFIRVVVITSLLNCIIILILILIKHSIINFLIVLNGILCFFQSSYKEEIVHFYDMKLLPHYYFSSQKYVSFTTEVVCSLLEICILVIIVNIILSVILKKKRDIL